LSPRNSETLFPILALGAHAFELAGQVRLLLGKVLLGLSPCAPVYADRPK